MLLECRLAGTFCKRCVSVTCYVANAKKKNGKHFKIKNRRKYLKSLMNYFCIRILKPTFACSDLSISVPKFIKIGPVA